MWWQCQSPKFDYNSNMPPSPAPSGDRTLSRILDREEYVEQTYFFRTFRDRLADNMPSQEILRTVGEEILATTKLPTAIEFMAAEAEHQGLMSAAMKRLNHYFAPFQAFVVEQAELDRTKLTMDMALEVLEREAAYRAGDGYGRVPCPAGLFVYQFEAMSRNSLGFRDGMEAIAGDPLFNDDWRSWLLKIRHELGTVEFAEMIYTRSEQRVDDINRRRQQEGNDEPYTPSFPLLFNKQAGRIAKANLKRDPLYMFAALQRQLDYPKVPRPERRKERPEFEPHVELRFQRLEAQLQMLEGEIRDDLDLSQFMPKQ